MVIGIPKALLVVELHRSAISIGITNTHHTVTVFKEGNAKLGKKNPFIKFLDFYFEFCC